MLKLGRVTKVKMFFLVLVYVFNIDLFEFSATILGRVYQAEKSEQLSVLKLALRPYFTIFSGKFIIMNFLPSGLDDDGGRYMQPGNIDT